MTMRHGTATMYRKTRCRCAPCRYAASVSRNSATPLADPAPVAAHVGTLTAAGIGRRRLSEIAGVSRATVDRVLAGSCRPTARVAAAFLAIPVDLEPPPKWLDPTGTTRRLRALTAIGWPNVDIAAAAGMDLSYLAQMTKGQRRLTAAKVDAVRRVYDKLSMDVPADSYGSNRARLRALDRRWFPPLAWDDETIDVSDALPCLLPPLEPVDRGLELDVQHVVAGHDVEVTQPVRWEIVRRLPDARSSEVAALARCDVKHVSHVRRKLAAAC